MPLTRMSTAPSPPGVFEIASPVLALSPTVAAGAADSLVAVGASFRSRISLFSQLIEFARERIGLSLTCQRDTATPPDESVSRDWVPAKLLAQSPKCRLDVIDERRVT